MLLSIIRIERTPLLQVYFSYFIAKRGTIFKYIFIEEDTQFCSACFSIGLFYYGPANWPFRRHTTRELFIIIIYYKDFLYFLLNQFFQKNVFFWVLLYENQESFGERCSLISGILQGLVKTCKKYIEVNQFLLLSCSLEK